MGPSATRTRFLGRFILWFAVSAVCIFGYSIAGVLFVIRGRLGGPWATGRVDMNRLFMNVVLIFYSRIGISFAQVTAMTGSVTPACLGRSTIPAILRCFFLAEDNGRKTLRSPMQIFSACVSAMESCRGHAFGNIATNGSAHSNEVDLAPTSSSSSSSWLSSLSVSGMNPGMTSSLPATSATEQLEGSNSGKHFPLELSFESGS